jgi:hypothetical protein
MWPSLMVLKQKKLISMEKFPSGYHVNPFTPIVWLMAKTSSSNS